MNMSFFGKVWKLLADDIQYNMRRVLNNPTYQMTDNQFRDHLLDTLDGLFSKRGSNISDYNLPKSSNSTTVGSTNHLIDDELGYDAAKLLDESDIIVLKLNDEQMHAFKCIVDVVLFERPEFFFVSGYGGTGKTFLWNTIITYLRANKKIVLPVASSGAASLLLPRGRTSHSRFKIPCDDLDETTTCNIKWGTMLCELIQASSLIIWDEALMTNKIAFEALDRTLRDTVPSSQKNKLPFGGKVVVLRGDLRQTLHVIDCASR
jgi:hypothetical protein